MLDDKGSEEGESNNHKQTLSQMLNGGGCTEAWTATSELRQGSDEESTTSRRNVLKGVASGAVAVPFGASDMSISNGQQLRIPDDVRTRLGRYAEDMDAVRNEFAHHASDILSELSDRGVITEASPTALAGLAVDGDPLATDAPVHVDLLGVDPDSYFDDPMTILTAPHAADGVQLDLTVIPEQEHSQAYFNTVTSDPNGFARVSSTSWCDGELVDIYKECGITNCQKCSGWPSATYKTKKYWVRVYDEPDGKCSETYADTCSCNYNCWGLELT